MTNSPNYVTAEGLQNLKDELTERTEVRRVEIAERLHAAIKMGDLKENADYHAAKEDQAFNEGRIQRLEDAILNAVLIDENTPTDRVRLGSTVTIAEVDYEDEEETYRIVGPQEADPGAGLISNVSPIATALLGARVGDVVTAATPGGDIDFKVISIS
ncbi:MAG: transcription elongation factor GreA [Anaerolineae bacterium]|nr:transcription elongation factor GreA [Anaerolineae bacterium]MCO5189191.1 transcription elongation factor GreA [Anaerolineae bacterium]MCO5195805.1 transcription elongation factor GreA [Anaerolineae bacterium]MCO5196321.1 transcription elongation factor GreA [Anaerolineae bacterium]MCO5204385.1 transcription elongation factor GreA [Anaerolineae bacterium]